MLYTEHGRCTLRYCGNHLNLRDSAAANKRRYNVFLICPAVISNDGAKIHFFLDMAKLFSRSKEKTYFCIVVHNP